MNLFYNISPGLKKILAILLLLYFIVSPLLFAFPIQECSGSCPMSLEMENCDMSMHEMDLNDCNMDMSSAHDFINSQNSCDMGISINRCMVENYYDSSCSFVVTQKYHSVNTLAFFSILDQFTDNDKAIDNENIQTFINEKSPPIYISVQSFLI